MSVWEIGGIVGCFLIGAIAFAKVAMLGTGVDITKVGSRNPGFNNVLRVSTKPRAAVALIGDISKGFVALLIFATGVQSQTVQWSMGIAAVMGHCWSPFLGWNGGKGVATTVGVLLFLDPKITVVCLPLYILLRAYGRRRGWKQEGAIASLSTMALIATAVLVAHGIGPGGFAYLMLGIVVLRHKENLREVFK